MDSRRTETTCSSMLSDARFPTTSPNQLKLRFGITCLFACFSFLFPFFFHEFVFELRKRCCPFRNETRPQNWTLQVVIRSTEQKAFFGLVTHSHVLSDILIKVHLKLLIFLIKRHLIISTTCKLPRVENVF